MTSPTPTNLLTGPRRGSESGSEAARSRQKGVAMKAAVFHAVGDIRVDDVPEPELQDPTDAIVRLSASAICGTDLHFVRGS